MQEFLRAPVLRRLALSSFALLPLGSCTLISADDVEQCTSDADCAELDQDTVCDVDAAVCVPRATTTASTSTTTVASTSTGDPSGCTSNQQCIDDSGGQPVICPAVGSACLPLFSQECSRFFPEDIGLVADDSVLILGHMANYTGDAQDLAAVGGNAVQLAAEELAEVGIGLPIGGLRRPVVFVSCDATESTSRAASHLVDTLKVPAIIGPEGPEAYELAVSTTIPSETLLLLNGDTSSEFESPFPDNGLVWHVNPSEASVASTFSVFLPVLEDKLRDETIWEGDIKVAAIVRSDVTSQATSESFFDAATFNGAGTGENQDSGNFRQFAYDPELPDFPGLVTGVADYAPNLIVVFANSSTEVVNGVLDGIEAEWEEAAPRPYYLLTPSVRAETGTSSLLENFVGDSEFAIEDRLFGARNALPLDRSYWDKYRLNYDARYEGANGGYALGPASYDSVYLLAYATLAAGEAPTLNGRAIASGFQKLLGPGATIGAGRSDINSALSALAAGAVIDFEGALSKYQFDPLTGIAPRRSVIWCAVPGATIDSTYYEEEDGTFDGEFGLCDKW